jgi:signal transduction histidine kinase
MHDLRAPLVSIGLVARSAAADLGDDHPVRSRLDQIAEKVLEIEEHLKAAGESTRGKEGREERVDIESVIHDALGLLGGLMMRFGVETEVRLHSEDATLEGSAIELRQMILNLLQNAVEAMSGGGTLTVETAREGDMVRIDVRDTGGGIPEDLQIRIFSAFFTTKTEGLGLGLFSAERIAAAHGGRIEMKSEEGIGTCFTVLLPLGK